MQDFVPYLQFAGNAKEAMHFYKSVLGGEFTGYSRYADIPGGEKLPEAEQEKFIHIALTIGNGHRIMASDAVEGMTAGMIFGNNLHICLFADSETETDQFFEGLSDDGKIMMPMNKTFWGNYYGMCEDKFGINWMITHEPKK